jgi:hypothetical protein
MTKKLTKFRVILEQKTIQQAEIWMFPAPEKERRHYTYHTSKSQ